LINKEIQKKEEHKAWQMWLSLYPDMIKPSQITKDKGPLLSFEPFSDFYRRNTQQTSQRPAEEILTEARSIRIALGKH